MICTEFFSGHTQYIFVWIQRFHEQNQTKANNFHCSLCIVYSVCSSVKYICRDSCSYLLFTRCIRIYVFWDGIKKKEKIQNEFPNGKFYVLTFELQWFVTGENIKYWSQFNVTISTFYVTIWTKHNWYIAGVYIVNIEANQTKNVCIEKVKR